MAESPTGVVPLDDDPRDGGGEGNDGGRKWEDENDREKSTMKTF